MSARWLRLVSATVLVGGVTVAVVAVVWSLPHWEYSDRWSEPAYWWRMLARTGIKLLFSKTGLEVVLAAVMVVLGGIFWIFERRSTTIPDVEAYTPGDPADPDLPSANDQ